MVPTYFSSTFNMLSKIKVLTAGIEGTLTHLLCVINIIWDVAYHQELYGLIDLLFGVFGKIKVLTAGIEGTLTHLLRVNNNISDVAHHQELYGLIDLLFAVFDQCILIYL